MQGSIEDTHPSDTMSPKIRNFPELSIRRKEVRFEETPARIDVRAEMSKREALTRLAYHNSSPSLLGRETRQNHESVI